MRARFFAERAGFGRTGAAWLLGVLAAWAVPPGAADASRLHEIRVGAHPGFTRVVLELDGPAGYRIEEPRPGAAPELVVEVDAETAIRTVPSKGPLVASVVVEPSEVRSTIRIGLKTSDIHVTEMILSRPPRLVLDLRGMSEGAAARSPAASDAQPEPGPAQKDSGAGSHPTGDGATGPAAMDSPPADAKPAQADAFAEPDPVLLERAAALALGEEAPDAAPPPPPAPELVPPAVEMEEAAAPSSATDAAGEPLGAPPGDPMQEPLAGGAPIDQPIGEPGAPGAPADEPVGDSFADEAPAEQPMDDAGFGAGYGSDSEMAVRMPDSPITPGGGIPTAPERDAEAPPRTMPAPRSPMPSSSAGAGGAVAFLSSPRGIGVLIAAAAVMFLGWLALRRRGSEAEELSPEFPDMEETPMRFTEDSPIGSEAPVEASGPTRIGVDAPPFESMADALADESDEASLPLEPALKQPAAIPVPIGTLSRSEPVGGDAMRRIQELERRISHLETRIEEMVEARERVERQVAAQTEELRVQRAAIARTQRVVRSMTRSDEMATEPVPRLPDRPGH